MMQLTIFDPIEIKFSNGRVAIIDPIDSDLIELVWSLSNNGYAFHQSYSGVKKQEYLHRIILSRMLGRLLSKKDIVDHIDHDSLNNRRSNLRLVSSSQNLRNARIHSNNTSGYKGVSWDKNNRKWHAYIGVNHKNVFLGRFDTAVDAARAYDAFAVEHFGEFALTNEKLGLYINMPMEAKATK